MKFKKTAALTAALITAAAVLLTGCGKDKASGSGSAASETSPKTTAEASAKPDSETGGDAQSGQTGDAGQAAPAQERTHDVPLEERTEEARYTYSIEDLSFVDTVSGKQVSIGMTPEEVEPITGPSLSDDQKYRVYDGLVAHYNDQGKLDSLSISNGLFPDQAQGTRYKSSRGVALYTPFEDFVKAYGDQYSQRQGGEDSPTETPAIASRYFRIDGDKVEYLGAQLTDEMKASGTDRLYMQDFIFDRETNQVITMRVSAVDALAR